MPTLVLLALGLAAAPAPPTRPVHTYSIVARDPATGSFGVAVQSHWFSVGSLVPWAEAGVGAVATQSFVEPSYGPLGLDLMRAGKSAPEALKALLAADQHPDVRQVAMVDAQGRAAAHTGDHCIVAAGHTTGAGYSVQANLMDKPTVWPAMSRAYEGASGEFAERLLAALDAAEREGGDIRGRQSAAILIVRGTSTGRPWADRLVDLRVDDSSEPLKELRRLLDRQRAYDRMNSGDEAVARNDNEAALKEYAAAAALVSDEPELVFWHAVALANMKRFDEAVALLQRVYLREPRWAGLTPRLVAPGLLSAEAAKVIATRTAAATPKP